MMPDIFRVVYVLKLHLQRPTRIVNYVGDVSQCRMCIRVTNIFALVSQLLPNSKMNHLQVESNPKCLDGEVEWLADITVQ